MRIAMVSPISRCTTSRHCGAWESTVSLLTKALVKMGIDVTLFSKPDLTAKLHNIFPHSSSRNSSIIPEKWECLHISEVFERASEFDLIHNHIASPALSFSGLINTPILTTIYSQSLLDILPAYKKFNLKSYYASISNVTRSPELDYIATIYPGIDISQFTFQDRAGGHLLFSGPVQPGTGVCEAIQVAKRSGRTLMILGTIHDQFYFKDKIRPFLEAGKVEYIDPADSNKRKETIAGAYALLHLDNGEEPCIISLLESLACGTPVVAYPRGSISEIISDGETGFIVNDLQEAALSVERISEIKRIRCRQEAETRFSTERMVKEYLQVYKKILAMEKPRAHHAFPPWGKWEVLLDEPRYKVKRITVEPGNRLSYQKHFKRAEHWMVVEGEAIVILDGKKKPLKKGETIDIPREAAHRIGNVGKKSLVFIEIQQGDYFGEDDIIRLEDDYGRDSGLQA